MMREWKSEGSQSLFNCLFIGLLVWIGLLCLTVCASAVTVPAVSVDAGCLTVKDQNPAVVTGTVSVAKGQKVVLYTEDGSTGTFQLSVPDTALKRPGTTKLCVKSLQAKGVTASALTKVTMKVASSQAITAPSSVTLTNLKTSASLKAKASSKLGLSYKSSNPKVVAVSSKGKLTRKKNGKVTITITQKGNGTYLAATKKVKVTSRKSTKQEQINGAVAWAVKIANDNSFTYGAGQGAHHFGCYFCGTNYGPNKYTKPSARYKKTYCCNPFVSAAYAHGAKHPKMLAACRRGSGIGMEKWTFYRYGCWKSVGHPSYRKLQKGDVLVKSNHVAMYIGDGKLVEASGGGWSAGSIAVKKMSGSRYNGFSFVMRYTGY